MKLIGENKFQTGKCGHLDGWSTYRGGHFEGFHFIYVHDFMTKPPWGLIAISILYKSTIAVKSACLIYELFHFRDDLYSSLFGKRHAGASAEPTDR